MKKLEIVDEAFDCVRRERSDSVEVLRYLREIEKGKIFLSEGHSSLFSFCVGRFKYSEPEAQLRIQTMRLMRAVPEVEGLLRSGKISMSVAALLQSTIRREKIPAEERTGIVREFVGTSKREAERKLAARFPREARRERATPINEDQVEIRFTVSRAEFAEIQAELDRTAHTNFERSYRVLFMKALKKKTQPAKASAQKNPQEKSQENHKQDAPLLRPLKRSRHIPAAIREAVWEKGDGKCAFCGTSHGVQIDHIIPYAQGGTHDLANLRLLCGAHNRWRM